MPGKVFPHPLLLSFLQSLHPLHLQQSILMQSFFFFFSAGIFKTVPTFLQTYFKKKSCKMLGKKIIRTWSLICLLASLPHHILEELFIFAWTCKKRRMPAVQTCSTSVASKKLFISVYQLLKRLDYIPNGLWLDFQWGAFTIDGKKN